MLKARRHPLIAGFLLLGMLLSDEGQAAANTVVLLPRPAQFSFSSTVIPIVGGLAIRLPAAAGPRLRAAASRFAARLGRATGLNLPLVTNGGVSVEIICPCAPRFRPSLNEDESYQMSVTAEGVRLRAAEEAGILHGFSTLIQLIQQQDTGFGFASGEIDDKPRFAWRGLMIDTARHFQSIAALKRQIDAMELVKLNVLHLHLSDADAFRVESKTYPKLHQLGSNGLYYSQQELHDLVTYAAERGIRIVPEFDIPGHSRAWLVAYPELASRADGAGPDTFESRRNCVIDPTRETTYRFLDRLLDEMARLFPDPWFHTGADEVNGVQWGENPNIQVFMKTHGLADTHALQGYFTRRVHAILRRHSKTMIGWDEILSSELPKDVVVQSWTSSKMTALAAKQGHNVVVSAGYYLDWLTGSPDVQRVDPLDPNGHGILPQAYEVIARSPFAVLITDRFVLDPELRMTSEDEARILGAEATMWTELVTEEKLDLTIWPRGAIFAERLWSKIERSEPDLAERLAVIDGQLALMGLQHRANSAAMLARLAPGDTGAVAVLARAIEPVKFYAHNQEMRSRAAAPAQQLNRVADAVPPESLDALRFNQAAKIWNPGDAAQTEWLRIQLIAWRDNDAAFAILAKRYPMLAEAVPISRDLSALAAGALRAIDLVAAGRSADADWIGRQTELLDRHTQWWTASATPIDSLVKPQPPGDLLLAPLEGLRALILRPMGNQ